MSSILSPRMPSRKRFPEALISRFDAEISVFPPIEQVIVEDVDKSGDIKYYRDEQGAHHVPKRTLQELIWES